jgi:hypothetical protein
LAAALIGSSNRGEELIERRDRMLFEILTRLGKRTLLTALMPLVGVLFFHPLSAQQQGPLTPPPQTSVAASAPAATPPSKAPADRQSPSGITQAPPSIPVDQIIQRFAAHEAEFRTERNNFTYVQTFIIQTIDDDGRADGEYRMTSDIIFTPAGERVEEITNAPPPTLQRISMSEQDLNDLKNIQPFVLTTEDLPKYNIVYVGREQVDELGTYVFDASPKTIEKNQRYFQGRVWVDDKDLEVVKTYGKAVPDIRKGKNENVFPRFETYRENIEGHYWFPTYTHSDDVLHFTSGDVHIRMTVRYADYKRFGSSVRILKTDPTKQ